MVEEKKTEAKGFRVLERASCHDINAQLVENTTKSGKCFVGITVSRRYFDKKSSSTKWQNINLNRDDFHDLKTAIERLEQQEQAGKFLNGEQLNKDAE